MGWGVCVYVYIRVTLIPDKADAFAYRYTHTEDQNRSFSVKKASLLKVNQRNYSSINIEFAHFDFLCSKSHMLTSKHKFDQTEVREDVVCLFVT